MSKYNTQQANAVLQRVTNGAFSIKSGFSKMMTPAYLYNHKTNEVEYCSPRVVMNRFEYVKYRQTHRKFVSHAIRNIIPISNDMKPNHFVSGNHYFQTLVYKGNHYVRVSNVVSYLNINKSSFFYVNRKLRGKNAVINIKSSPTANQFTNRVLTFGKRQRLGSFIKVKSLYKALRHLIYRKSRVGFHKDHARTLMYDVYDTYKNEIKGLTNLQAALDKHNARVESEMSLPKMPNFEDVSSIPALQHVPALQHERKRLVTNLRKYRRFARQYQTKIYKGFDRVKLIDRLLVMQKKSQKLFQKLFEVEE